ncbi:Oxr1p like TLDc domain containing [Cryptosporidium sp. chipmunk genotype I]|uniref:Oxr1p like TLDc domain containing n=1 Tax=Cryptosporidium sp. chipmunk genotype I TaxID=1280935 RepID=UPI00351A493D|nr:Oxr1p like TLDc domain containing [Cryptosporidium sp. chipmunk genotype I]
MWLTSFKVPEGAKKILNEGMVDEITSYLPIVLALRRWQLSFCSKLHGVSFGSFYRRVSNKGPSILVVRDTNGVVFGAFISESIRNSTNYYGTGEMFVFTYKQLSGIDTKNPTEKREFGYLESNRYNYDLGMLKKDQFTEFAVSGYKHVRDEGSSKKNEDSIKELSTSVPRISVFPWSGKNCFYIYTDNSRIAIGGGGSYSLTIDGEFFRGWSSPCSTYDSPSLSSHEDFLVNAFQVWTLVDDYQ